MECNSKFTIYAYFSFFILLMAFSPFLLFPFSLFSLLYIAFVDSGVQKGTFFVTSLYFAFWGMIVDNVSLPLFEDVSIDFISYYNNYLLFNNGLYLSGFNEFDIEVGVPLINMTLSFIGLGEHPFLVKLFHLSFQCALCLILLLKIKRSNNLTFNEFVILTFFILLFFKLSTSFQLLRQGYASFFVLFSLFDKNRKNNILFLIIASAFHLSSVVVYFVVKFILFDNYSKLKKYIIFLCFVLPLVLMKVNYSAIIEFIVSLGGGFLDKLLYVLYAASDEGGDKITNSIKNSIIQIMYFIPLIFILTFYCRSELSKKIKINLMLYSSLVIAFSVLPTFFSRLTLPVVVILVGYFYWIIYSRVCQYKNKVFILSLSIVIMVFLQYRNFTSPVWYYQYPPVGATPFYYANILFKEEKSIIDRYNLPSGMNIKNEHKF